MFRAAAHFSRCRAVCAGCEPATSAAMTSDELRTDDEDLPFVRPENHWDEALTEAAARLLPRCRRLDLEEQGVTKAFPGSDGLPAVAGHRKGNRRHVSLTAGANGPLALGPARA